MKTKILKSNIKNLLAILILVFLFLPTHRSEAAAWPAIDPIIKTALEKVEKQINGILLGAAKSAAITAVQQQITSLIGGATSGGAMFVTDWTNYLVKQPVSQANIFINDYISQSLQGRGSLTGYVPARSEGIGSGMNYQSRLAQGARNATSDISQPQVTFTGEPSQIFANGNRDGFQKLNLLFSGINYKPAYDMHMRVKYQEKLEEEKMAAQTKVIAGQGFTGTESNGITITPGSIVKDQLSEAQNMGMKMLATAQNLPEIITSAVSMTISRTIQQGIGSVQAQVNKEIANVRSRATAEINQAIRTSGPGAMYRR